MAILGLLLIAVPSVAFADSPAPDIIVPGSSPWDGQTSVTLSLQKMIAASPGGYSKDNVYKGGTGVLVRNPYDGYENGGPYVGKGGAYDVLPTTLLSEDIFSSNKVFPRFCAATGFDWAGCAVVYVIGSSMSNMFYEFDKIQTKDWGWGVFYPFDSNAVDFRCQWLEPKGTPKMYNCPGYSKVFGGKPAADANMFGAGYFPAGNPWANPKWGGGAGCHFSGLPYGCNDKTLCTNDIDSVDRPQLGKDLNLVQDPSCQCNYKFADDWSHWVNSLGDMSKEKTKGTLPEAAMCWTNNIKDMINLQNNLYWSKDTWFASGEKGDRGPSGMWGWNEVPMPRTGSGGITNPTNWDAVVIKMPLYVCKSNGGNDHLGCISSTAATNLETDLSKWVKDKLLVPGAANIGKRPGSYVVLMREWYETNHNSHSYFFCECWSSPGRKWEVVYIPPAGKDTAGACYIEKGIGFQESDLEGPFPEPYYMSNAEAKAIHRLRTARVSNNSTLMV